MEPFHLFIDGLVYAPTEELTLFLYRFYPSVSLELTFSKFSSQLHELFLDVFFYLGIYLTFLLLEIAHEVFVTLNDSVSTSFPCHFSLEVS